MRLFLDANVMTYIAIFEGYLVEGTPGELAEAAELWKMVQGNEPDQSMVREIEALRILYLVDDAARFDWLFSDLALAEIGRIKSIIKREMHRGLLSRLIEHRSDVYPEGGFPTMDRDALRERVDALFATLPPKMRSDAEQFCEAELVDACYFVTNDLPFIRVARATDATVEVRRPGRRVLASRRMGRNE